MYRAQRSFAAVRPRIGLVSARCRNRFGDPVPGTIGRLHAAGARIYPTDLCGAIVSGRRRAPRRCSRAPEQTGEPVVERRTPGEGR